MDSKFNLGEIKLFHIMLYCGLFTWRGNCYYSFTNIFIAVAINIHDTISFNIECFKNFLPFSSIPFTITGAQLNEAGKKKLDSGNCLTMHVTFNVFICNRMIKLKIASKRGELQSNNEELGKYTLAVILKITVC